MRTHGDVRVEGSIFAVWLAYLGGLGIDRYELQAQVTLRSGMFEHRVWLLTREELERVCLVTDDATVRHEVRRYIRAAEAAQRR